MVSETELKENGYTEKAIDCVCPHCVTVAEFASVHKTGKYILICQDREILVDNGLYSDTDNAGDEIVLYYYEGAK